MQAVYALVQRGCGLLETDQLGCTAFDLCVQYGEVITTSIDRL